MRGWCFKKYPHVITFLTFFCKEICFDINYSRKVSDVGITLVKYPCMFCSLNFGAADRKVFVENVTCDWHCFLKTAASSCQCYLLFNKSAEQVFLHCFRLYFALWYPFCSSTLGCPCYHGRRKPILFCQNFMCMEDPGKKQATRGRWGFFLGSNTEI